jgi:RNA polymerase sigma-70 factor (ECF subfamily)
MRTRPTPTATAEPGRIRPRIGSAPRKRRDWPLTRSESTDEELLALARQGEEGAFDDFVRRHTATVHRWMARSVGEDDADDMTQEVFVNAYRGLSRFRGEAPPRAWLAAIANNAVKNRYRSRSRFRRVFAGSTDADPEREPREPGAGPEEKARTGESRRAVAEALKLLPPDFRMPVVLRDIEEWSYEEIAASLALPIGTVKSRIARGRGQLKEILAPLLSGNLP